MSEKEFCLLDEQWICVIDEECRMSQVSLLELFRNAHTYKDLRGELPTQDFAVMRLLLAILHTVFSRYDANGQEVPMSDADDALDRWEALWQNGRFPPVVEQYLESQRERFYLFHPDRPFYQVERAKIGTEYGAAKLYGILSESNNKVRLFSNIGGGEKESMTFAQAARWLLYVNAYDDTSAKPSSEAKSSDAATLSPGAGWLGKLGPIYVLGDNLFETLMLNLILLNENRELYGAEKPVWERETPPDGERVQINQPNNLAELYTLQSRRLFLKRNEQKVIGYYLLGGDFFDKENAFVEPMTAWRFTSNKKLNVYTPRRHDSSKQFWREFSTLVLSGETYRCPGIVSWMHTLDDSGILSNRLLNFRVTSVQYGDKDFFVTNTFSDSLQMHAALISNMRTDWQQAVIDSITFCDDIAKRVYTLAREVDLAAGGDFDPKNDNSSAAVAGNQAKNDFYAQIDTPFRRWLCALNPDVDQSTDKKRQWRSECVHIARRLSEKIIEQSDPVAIFGKKTGHSAAKAKNTFDRQIKAAEQA